MVKKFSRVLTIFALFVTVLSLQAHAKYTATVNVDTLDVYMYSVINAYLYDDGSLIFDYKPDPSLGYVVEEFPDVGSSEYTSYDAVPWDHVRSEITRVEYRNGVSPEHREYWFYECINLHSMVLPDNTDRVCTGEFYYSGITGDIIIPEGVVDIGTAAFSSCYGVNGSLTFPNTLKSIQGSAFSDNGVSGSLIIPDSVEYIGSSAFDGCSSLDGSLKLPSNLRRIEQNTFNACLSLTGTLSIPDGVVEIGRDAFRACRSLTGNLVIPDSVTEISSGAFTGCNNLGGKLILSNNLTTIEDRTFESCVGIDTIIMPRNLVSINGSAFKNVTAKTIDFNGANVSNMAQGCFLYENGYMVTTLLGHNSYIDGYDWAKDNRGIFGKVNAYLYSDGKLVFDLYPSGSNGTLVATYNNVGTSEYMSESDVPWDSKRGSITSVEYRNGVAPVHREYWFAYCYNLETAIVPDGVDRVCNNEFDTSGVSSMSIPEGVSQIGDSAFSGCSWLFRLDLPSSIQFIGDYAFFSCWNMSNIVLPDNVYHIGEAAFDGCYSIGDTFVTPRGLLYLGDRAFANIPSLTKIYFYCHNLEYIGVNCFYVSNITDGSYPVPVETIVDDSSSPIAQGYDWESDNRVKVGI